MVQWVRTTIHCWLFLIGTAVFLTPQIIQAEESPKICLTMIVKNESKIIERCLSAVEGVADAICICDTGSSDNTVEIIENFLKKKNIPGKVFHHQWQNFGHNRSLSSQAAVSYLSENNHPLHEWYLLLLDADMLLKKEKNFSKKDLLADAYQLRQANGYLSYQNIRLIKASLPWKCIGVTHEYWHCDGSINQQRLSSLWIDDKNDGGCKADKFERDVRLLTAGLEKEPNNSRYMFYLAQSYLCLGKYDEAIKWYQERIKNNDFFEEVWYSHYMIGTCFAKKNEWDHALQSFLKAFSFNPARNEPLIQVAQYYLQNKLYSLAHLFAKHAAATPYPKTQSLFIEDSAYSYVPDEIISVAGYYVDQGKKDGLEASDRLVLKKTTPANLQQQTLANMQFYATPLQGMKIYPLTINCPEVIEGSKISYRPINPSIQKTADGYSVILRTVNFGLGETDYYPLHPDIKTYNTKNFLLKLNKDFSIISSKEITETLDRVKHISRPVTGLEDCRLFALNTENEPTYCTCTTLDTNPAKQPQISLIRFHEEEERVVTDALIPLQSPDQNRCEKNWLPFMKDNVPHVIYSYDPFIIYSLNPDNGQLQKVKEYTPKGNFSKFRGSAGPIPFNDGYLLVVHEISQYLKGQRRIYLHRFVYLDKNFKISKVSHPFTFLHTGTEFCCGMSLDHTNTNVILTFGIEDKEAYLGVIDVEKVASMLFNQG